MILYLLYLQRDILQKFRSSLYRLKERDSFYLVANYIYIYTSFVRKKIVVDVSCTDLPSLFHFIVRGYASSSINLIFPITINTNAIPTFPKVSEPSFLFLSSPLPRIAIKEGGKYNNTRRDSTQMRTNRKPETVPRRCFENARRTLGAWKSSRRFFQANLRKGGETLFSEGSR